MGQGNEIIQSIKSGWDCILVLQRGWEFTLGALERGRERNYCLLLSGNIKNRDARTGLTSDSQNDIHKNEARFHSSSPPTEYLQGKSEGSKLN